MKKSKIVLFDIDYTLFNTDSYRDHLYKAIGKELGYPHFDSFFPLARKISRDMQKELGYYNPDVFLQRLLTIQKTPTSLENLERIFWDEQLYLENLYEDVQEVIEILTDNGTAVGIFSKGTLHHQKHKLRSLKHLFADEHIHIFENKIEELPRVLKKYSDYEIFIVDDLPEVLAAAKSVRDGMVITIQIIREKIHDVTPEISGFTPDMKVNTLRDVLPTIMK
jgi:phosphoglycolate phosphatase-like HAD superfamily hydrolase